MLNQGQIVSGSYFADSIDLIFKHIYIKHIVEIGTWKGLGSTKVIIDSIRKYNLGCSFLTIEANQYFFEIAKKNLEPYSKYVSMVNGTICAESDILDYLNIVGGIPNNTYAEWLEADLADLKLCKRVDHLIPDRIDFLLLDGGEFSTYSEWHKLKNRSHIIALDDTHTLKCKYIREQVLQEKNKYEIIIDSNDRNGFMILKNKNYE